MTSSGSYYSKRDDSKVEWPPPPDKARSAALTVAELTEGDPDRRRDVLDALGLREVLR